MKNILKSVLESAVLGRNKIFIIFQHSYLNFVQCNVLNFLNFLLIFLRY